VQPADGITGFVNLAESTLADLTDDDIQLIGGGLARSIRSRHLWFTCMREVVIVRPRIVVVMWRLIFVSIMPREMPLVVVVGGFVLTMMSALFVVIMMSIIVGGRPFEELFIMSRVRGRWNRAVA